MKIILNILIVSTLLLSSCKSYQKIVYFQEAGQTTNLAETHQDVYPEPIIKNGDLLMITVNTESPEAASAFNPPIISDPSEVKSPSKMTSVGVLQSYLVDESGEITFPIIGKLKVAGLTRKQLETFIGDQTYPRFLKEKPMVVAKILNYTVSVLGEVNKPGTVQVENARISITKALSDAGDLTIYGRRDNVMLIREDQWGKRTTYRINLTDKNLITSPFYFLQQNDVIYVEPNQSKARSSMIGASESLSFTIVGTLISIVSLIATLTR